jgi:hypothetical protein
MLNQEVSKEPTNMILFHGDTSFRSEVLFGLDYQDKVSRMIPPHSDFYHTSQDDSPFISGTSWDMAGFDHPSCAQALTVSMNIRTRPCLFMVGDCGISHCSSKYFIQGFTT